MGGVVKILDCFDSPDCYYIVMEKFKSKDLFDFITEQGPLPERNARRMFTEIIKTVIECRDAGVLHRDIKDENILVDMNTMKTKLIDFGSGCFFNNKTEENKISMSSEAPESTLLRSGSRRENTLLTVSPPGVSVSSSMTCSVVTSPTPMTERSALVRSTGITTSS